jgi:hypothetical protein
MPDGKVAAEIGRLERTLLGTLQLHAQELQHSLQRIVEDMKEMEERVCNVENEVGALIRREGLQHGQKS